MSDDPRDRASAAAAAVAEIVARPDSRPGMVRMATGDPSQVETLADAVAAHVAALPRKYGDVDRLTIYDGEAPIGEFEGGGGAALDVARFLVMRATLEGKRLSFHIAVQVKGSEREVTRWRFFARPDASGAAVSPGDPATAGVWNPLEAARLQAVHNHQLVQELIGQSRHHAAQLADLIRAQSEVLRSVGAASAKVLDQLSTHATALQSRVTDAEEAARVAARDARDHAEITAAALSSADDATREMERMRREADEDPTRRVVAGAVQGITEGFRLRVAGPAAATTTTTTTTTTEEKAS